MVRTFILIVTMLMASSVSSAAPGEEEQTRVARDMVRVLEAYAVYKMGQYEPAFEKYLALAQDGNRQGMLNVANMYAEGKGTAQSPEQAFAWYLRLAQSGDRIGMEAVAQAYREGAGTAPDPEEARRWEKRLAAAR